MLLELCRAKMEAAKGIATAVIIGSGQDSPLATQNVAVGPAAPTTPGSLQEMQSLYLTTHLLNQNDRFYILASFLRKPMPSTIWKCSNRHVLSSTQWQATPKGYNGRLTVLTRFIPLLTIINSPVLELVSFYSVLIAVHCLSIYAVLATHSN